MTFFGNIEDAARIELEIEQTIRDWHETYCREVERQSPDIGADIFQPIATYDRKSYIDNLISDEFMPRCSIVSPGMVDRPRKDGRHRHRGTWRVDVAMQVARPDDPRSLAQLWASVIRVCVLQKKLPNLDAFVDWVGERYDDLTPILDRSMGLARVQFEIELNDVATAGDGPPDPSDDPGPVPTIETHKETLNRKEDM